MDRKKWMLRLFFLVMIAALVWAGPAFAGAKAAKNSSALINDAYKAGTIDRETYLIETLKSYFAPDLVQERFESATPNKPTRSITPLLDEALRSYSSLSTESKAFLSIFLKRPTDATYTWPWDASKKWILPTDKVKTFEPDAATYPNIGGKFKFWYVDVATTDADAGANHITTLDFVKKMAGEFETVYKKEITDMGFAAPPADAGDATHGGDTKFDVYVMNCGKFSVYGYVSREDLISGNSYPSFMVMDNNFTEFATATITADQAMQVTAAHEYHHAVQNGINGLADSWYKECTSTWMEEQVYPTVNDNVQYLNGTDANAFFYNPETPLDTATDHWYGTWVWNEFLKNKYDNTIVKGVWDNLDAAGSNNAVDALITTITGKGSTLKEMFTGFAAKNYSRVGFYADAALYTRKTPHFPPSPHTLDFSGATTHIVTEQTVAVNHLASLYFKFLPGATLTKPTTLNIQVEGAADKVNAIAIVQKKDGSFTEYPFTLDSTTGKGEVGIAGFSATDVKEVMLAIPNFTKADDAVSVKYKASLLKNIAFAIDDTGSMSSNIYYARAAAVSVLNDNKAAGRKNFYTLFSFKDGPGTLRGQTSDEDTMIGMVNSLYASGGAGCQESSLLTIRQAANLVPGADIFMMTDASSNSYGVDYTDATWGEVFETISTLLSTGSRLHSIIYSDCGWWAASGAKTLQCSNCPDPDTRGLRSSSSGKEGYNLTSGESGGLYFNISSSATTDALKIILTASSSNSTIAMFDAAVDANYVVPVDASIIAADSTQLLITLNNTGGGSATMTVKNPSATAVDGSTAGVTITTAGNNTSYLIKSPALVSGEWTVSVTGATAAYRIAGTATSTNSMDYTGDTKAPVSGTTNLQAQIKSTVTNPVFKLVSLDGTTSTNVTLTSTDGLNYSGSAVIALPGSFRFLMAADGNYQRMHPGIITVGTLDVVPPSDVTVLPGAATTVTHTFQVKNLSTADDTFNLYSASSLKWADLSGIPSSVTVAAGGTVTYNIPVNVPSTSVNGQIDVLSLQAVSQSNILINDAAQVQTLALITLVPLHADKKGTGTGTITSNPAGMNCGATCTLDAYLGSNVTLYAAADTGSRFVDWLSNECAETSDPAVPCTVTMTGEMTVPALFVQSAQVALLTGTSGNGSGTVTVNAKPTPAATCGTGCAIYPLGKRPVSVIVKVTPDSNSLMTGWDGGVCKGKATTCVVSMKTDKTVIARLEKKVPKITLNKTTVDFGKFKITKSKTNVTLRITNKGTGPLTLTAFTIGGANAADFKTKSAKTPPIVLKPNMIHMLPMVFTPSAIGYRYGTLTIASDDPSSPLSTVTLIGEGTAK